MKCLVCGREMLNRGTYLECPNILCDYDEEIGNNKLDVPAGREQKIRTMIFDNPGRFSC